MDAGVSGRGQYNRFWSRFPFVVIAPAGWSRPIEEDEDNLRVYSEPTALSRGTLVVTTYQDPVEITSAAATVTAPKPLED